MTDQSGPTPPQIVRRASHPERALGAFIAQELENWNFTVEADATDEIYIAANPYVLKVAITVVEKLT